MTLPNIHDNDRDAVPVPAPREQDLPQRVPGQELDQGSSSGRRLDQDPLNAGDDDDIEYTYVRLPNGSIRAVPKADIEDVPETATQTVPKAAMVEVEDPHFYAWLANGDVIRVKQSDLPPAAGADAQYGFWQIDDKVFQIVNVFPVESKVKGSANE